MITLQQPDANIIIIADDDQVPGTDANVGRDGAEKAARAIGARVALPNLGRKADAWDVYNEQGPEGIRAMFDAAYLVTGWTQPYLPWLLREKFLRFIRIYGADQLVSFENYWRMDPNHPFYLSPDRIQIRTQNDRKILSQWQQQLESLLSLITKIIIYTHIAY